MTPATRAILPRPRIWLLEAPAGVPSIGPLVVGEHGLAEVQPLRNAGWLQTGPYVLDPAAALEAEQEVAHYRTRLDRQLAGITLDNDRPSV